MVNSKKNSVYLLGGYIYNDNFGDILQAKIWVDWYKKRRIPLKFLCHSKAVNRCTSSLGLTKDQVISLDQFGQDALQSRAFLHLYGGGYINKYWSTDYAEPLKTAVKVKMPIFATGLQLDIEGYNSISRFPIKMVSVRDSLSKKIARLSAKTPNVDDSFGQLLKNRKKEVDPSNKVFLHLSLTNYILENRLQSWIATSRYKGFLQKLLAQNFQLILCSTFPENTNGVVEGKRLLSALHFENEDFKSASILSGKDLLRENYRAVVTNSFHLYLTAVKTQACPVFFLAFNQYYRQKAQALQDYKLLHGNNLSTSLSDLSTLPKKICSYKQTSFVQPLSKMTDRFEKVQKTVGKIIGL